MSDAMVLHLQEQVDALKQENARLREALTEIASGKLIDCVGAAKKALEAGDE